MRCEYQSGVYRGVAKRQLRVSGCFIPASGSFQVNKTQISGDLLEGLWTGGSEKEIFTGDKDLTQDKLSTLICST